MRLFCLVACIGVTVVGCGPEVEGDFFEEAFSHAPPEVEQDAEISSDVLREESHDVFVGLEDGNARFRVRRTFRSTTFEVQEADVEVELPPNFALSRFALESGNTWNFGTLMERGEAVSKYVDLLETG